MERRGQPRLAIELNAEYVAEGDRRSVPAQIENLSADGLAFLVPDPLEPGAQRLSVRFLLPGELPPGPLTPASIVRTEEGVPLPEQLASVAHRKLGGGETGWLLGLRFEGISDEDRERIRKFVDTRLKRTGVPVPQVPRARRVPFAQPGESTAGAEGGAAAAEPADEKKETTRAELQSELATARRDEADARRRLDDLRAVIDTLRHEFDVMRRENDEQLARTRAAAEMLRAELEEAIAAGEALREEVSSREGELETERAAAASLRAELETERAAAEALRGEFEEAVATREVLSKQLKEARFEAERAPARGRLEPVPAAAKRAPAVEPPPGRASFRNWGAGRLAAAGLLAALGIALLLRFGPDTGSGPSSSRRTVAAARSAPSESPDAVIEQEPTDLEVERETRPPASSPQRPATTAGMPIEQAEEAVRRWAAAWSAQRIDDYLEAYSPSFLPPGGSNREDWKALRRERLGRPAWIRVTLEEMEATGLHPGRARVSFEQFYESPSYRDRVRKTLELAREEGGWRITSERVD